MRKSTKIIFVLLAIGVVALIIWLRPSVGWAYTNIR